MRLYVLKIGLKLRYSFLDMPPVRLQLFLSGAPRSYAAAKTGKRRSLSRKAGERVFELSELHLYLSFV